MVLYALEDRRVALLGTEHYVAPTATLIGSIVLHDRCSIWFNAVLRGDNEPIVIGEGSNIQDGTICHTDAGIPLVVGAGVTVGHMAMLHGCTIGDDSLIGIGAVLLNRVKVGRNCIVGSKALLPEGMQIPDNSLVLGIPGRLVREVSAKEAEGLRRSAEHYVENMRRYLRSLRADQAGG